MELSQELTEMLEEIQDQEERKPSYWKKLTRPFRCCYKHRHDDSNRNSEYYRIETHSLMIIPEQSAEDIPNQVYFCTVKSRVSESPEKVPSKEELKEEQKEDQKEQQTEEHKETEEEKPQCSKSIRKERKFRIKKLKKGKEKPIPVVNSVEK